MKLMIGIIVILLICSYSCSSKSGNSNNIKNEKIQKGEEKSDDKSAENKTTSVIFAPDTEIKYYSSGEILEGYLAKSQIIKGVYFSYCTLQTSLSQTVNSGDKQLDATVNLWIKSMSEKGMNVVTPQFKLVPYPMVFYKNGQPKYGRLFRATTLQNIPFSNSEFIYFYESGKIKSGVILKKTVVNGKNLSQGDRIFLNEDGSLQKIESFNK